MSETTHASDEVQAEAPDTNGDVASVIDRMITTQADRTAQIVADVVEKQGERELLILEAIREAMAAAARGGGGAGEVGVLDEIRDAITRLRAPDPLPEGAMAQLRDYQTLRTQLASPLDSVSVHAHARIWPRVVGFDPPAAAVGKEIAVHLVNGGRPELVGFAAEGGGLAESRAKAGSTPERVLVDVPQGAITGRLSVVTSSGTAVSDTDFTVAARVVRFVPHDLLGDYI